MKWPKARGAFVNQGLDQSKANVNEKGGKPMLELLCGISGAFRPGFMTCLMGVSGAGASARACIMSSFIIVSILPSFVIISILEARCAQEFLEFSLS